MSRRTEPFLPFTRPDIDEATIAHVAEVLRSGWLTTGPRVAEFERALAAYVGGGRTVRVMTSATAALEIALLAAGVGPGDEVLVPAMTFAASANVVVRVGATPRFVDVDLRSRNATPEAFAQALGPRTKALMPVHFAGLAVELDGIHALARERGLRVIEDAAHAIGTAYRGRRIGSFGDLVCFSFHPNKNMTTIEGGAIAYDATARGGADETRLIERERFHGIEKDADGTVDVHRAGGKFNLADVAAAIGLGQLPRLDDFNRRRRALAGRYFERLEGVLPPDWLPARGDEGHSWHIYTVLLPFGSLGFTRPQFVARMGERGLGVGVHYPSVPSHSYYRERGHDPARYPNAARIGAETVTLPLFPAMEFADVDRVCDALVELVGRRAAA